MGEGRWEGVVRDCLELGREGGREGARGWRWGCGWKDCASCCGC